MHFQGFAAMAERYLTTTPLGPQQVWIRAEPAASAQVSVAQDALLFFGLLTLLCDSKRMAVGFPDFAEASPLSCESASAFLAFVLGHLCGFD